MLDAFIIEQIKQEELERQQRQDEGRRIYLELPRPRADEDRKRDEPEMGPIVIPLYPEIGEDAA
jgi:hypothetical protein